MNNLEIYLKQNIDEHILIKKYNAKEVLSPYLAGGYTFYKVHLLNTDFYLVRPLEERTTIQLQKQIQNMEFKLGEPVAVWIDQLTPYKKKKYLSEKIAFICADDQMFLPFLGLQLQIRTKEQREENGLEHFTPMMQLIYLRILYSDKEEWTQQEVSDQLKVTTMSASRTLEKFVKIGLLDYTISGRTGRKKIYQCKNKKKYYMNGKKYLVNPIKQIFYASSIPIGVHTYVSGLSALGKLTMLEEPNYSIVATNPNEIGKLKKVRISREEAIEESLCEVQVMKYDIALLTSLEWIDPLSLVYSLNEKDERIEIAINEMLEEYEWYEG